MARSFRVTVPARLVPYLTDMLRGGLYGVSLTQTVISSLQNEINREVMRGAIPLRVHGKVDRWIAPQAKR